jgi:tetratricopeptide (TPR) repeat protein
LIKKAQEKLNKSIQLKPDYSKAALVLGQISYNAGVELQIQAKAIHGAKPEDVKKRTELRAQATKKFDEAIPYFEKVDQILGSQGNLKMEDRTALKDAYDLLITIYEQKNVKDKAASYTTKFNNVDKDHHP